MKTREVIDAIEQMKVHCQIMLETNVYEPVCARGILYTLGYHDPSDVMTILLNIADGGFRYCLDPDIKCSNGDPDNPKDVFPSLDVCYWGPDQLKSRLDSLYW
jgi:hypothetical protein